MIAEPLLLTVDQLAELLQLPRSTTYEQLARHTIPGAIRIGRHLRVNRHVVVDWLSGEKSRPRSKEQP